MRRSVPAALAAMAFGLPIVFVGSPAPAVAVFLEVNPSTVQAGEQVGLRASCNDNLGSATVSSGIFGTVKVTRTEGGFLQAVVKVPASTAPGDYQVDLTCSDKTKASAKLHVVAKVQPTRGPATGGGGTAPGRNAPLLIGAGSTLLAAGAVLAAMALRRRRFG